MKSMNLERRSFLRGSALLAAAGLGIAVGNAVAELKNAADIVTEGCRNEGFEEGLRRFVLNTE